jgi:hypothetical protein
MLRIRYVFPDSVSRIRLFSIPDPDPGFALKNLSSCNPRNCLKDWLPDPGFRIRNTEMSDVEEFLNKLLVEKAYALATK